MPRQQCVKPSNSLVDLAGGRRIQGSTTALAGLSPAATGLKRFSAPEAQPNAGGSAAEEAPEESQWAPCGSGRGASGAGPGGHLRRVVQERSTTTAAPSRPRPVPAHTIAPAAR